MWAWGVTWAVWSLVGVWEGEVQTADTKKCNCAIKIHSEIIFSSRGEGLRVCHWLADSFSLFKENEDISCSSAVMLMVSVWTQPASSYLDWISSRVQVLTRILSITYTDSVSGLAHCFINEQTNFSNIDCYVSHSANTIYDYWNLQLWKYSFLKLNKSRWITPTLFSHYITLSQHKLTNGPEQKCRQIC